MVPGSSPGEGNGSISSIGKSSVLITRAGCKFESCMDQFYKYSSLAQLVERTTVNRDVTGSIPVGRANSS